MKLWVESWLKTMESLRNILGRQQIATTSIKDAGQCVARNWTWKPWTRTRPPMDTSTAAYMVRSLRALTWWQSGPPMAALMICTSTAWRKSNCVVAILLFHWAKEKWSRLLAGIRTAKPRASFLAISVLYGLANPPWTISLQLAPLSYSIDKQLLVIWATRTAYEFPEKQSERH